MDRSDAGSARAPSAAQLFLGPEDSSAPSNATSSRPPPPLVPTPPGLGPPGLDGATRPAPPPVPSDPSAGSRPPAPPAPSGGYSTEGSRPPAPPVPSGSGSQRPPAPPVPGDDFDDLPTATDSRHNPPKYEEHIDLKEAERRLKDGTLIRGILTVSGSKPSNAWLRPDGVKSKNEGKDVVIMGRNNRNRAVHRDVVYVEIISEEGDASESDNDDFVAPVTRTAAGPLESDSDSDDEKVCFGGGGVLATEEPERRKERGPGKAKAAKVVAVSEAKGRDRVIVCTLHPFEKGAKSGEQSREEVSESDRVLLAKPTDRRMPWMMLQINDVTRGVLKIPGKLNKYEMWPIQIVVWKPSSHLPLGRLKGSCLGQAGDLEAEVKHALIENELDDHDVDFEDNSLDEVDDIVVKAKAEFENERKRRDDLQKKRVFTIDPATAKDLDDAIHVDRDDVRGEIEVGVHIADVGHFLKLGTITDTEAQRRTTSVYLIDRVLPMLPHALCNHLCSLNPNEAKLSFSAFFRLNMQTGELIEEGPYKPWFKKTVIKSCCRLNYEEVQDVLDGSIEQTEKIVYGNNTWKQIEDDIFLLYDVCGKVRRGRMEGGAMSITKTKMIFHTRESEDGMPTGYHLESHSASHWIIEELMLLANRCVATHLAKSHLSQEGAVLRNHKAPDPKKAEVLSNLMKNNLGINEWEAYNAGALYRSCQFIYKKYGPILGQCIEMMTMRAGMQQAEYFIYDNEPEDAHHFALNFAYYTHFTSPIRRYPDVLVHRVLYALISGEHDYHEKGNAEDLVTVCNEKKTASRRCQDQLDRAVFCVYLRKRQEWYYTIGNVLGFSEDRRGGGEDDNITIFCSQLGKEKKCQLCSVENLEQLQLYMEGVDDELLLPKSWKFRGKGYCELAWPSPNDPNGPVQKQKLQVLSCVPVVVIPTNTVPIDFAVFIVSPFHPRYGGVNQNIPEVSKNGFEWTEVDEDGVEVVHSGE